MAHTHLAVWLQALSGLRTLSQPLLFLHLQRPGPQTHASGAGLLCCYLCGSFAQDGALNDEELNTFQFLCFGQPLTPDELASVRQMVAERMADGLNDAGESSRVAFQINKFHNCCCPDAL